MTGKNKVKKKKHDKDKRKGIEKGKEKGKMERMFCRENAEELKFSAKERIQIGVLGLSRGVGASFVATGLAFLFSQDEGVATGFVDAAGYMRRNDGRFCDRGRGDMISVDERGGEQGRFMNVPTLYDALGMDRRFASRTYLDLFEMIEEKSSIRGIKNIDEKINWAMLRGVLDERENKKQDEKVHRKTTESLILNVSRVTSNLYADIVICDFGVPKTKKELESCLAEMDFVICVIEASPSKLMAGYEIFSELKRMQLRHKEVTGSDKKFIFVVNKMNAGVNKRQVYSYLKLKGNIEIPSIPSEFFYEAEFKCKIPLATQKIRKMALPYFEEIHKIITDF